MERDLKAMPKNMINQIGNCEKSFSSTLLQAIDKFAYKISLFLLAFAIEISLNDAALLICFALMAGNLQFILLFEQLFITQLNFDVIHCGELLLIKV
jgi:hypothetical protein